MTHSSKVSFELKRDNVQLIEFTIEGGLMKPQELKELSLPPIDPSLPLVVSGRGPQWLYAMLAHHYHFCRILATFEPRLGKGVVVEAPSESELGMVIDLKSGELSEGRLGANGVLDLELIKLGRFQLLKAEVRGGKFVEPFQLREVDWGGLRAQLEPSNPIVVYIMAPVWVGARLAAEFSNLAPWYAVYDPRLGMSVVSATHVKDVELGELMELKPTRLDSG